LAAGSVQLAAGEEEKTAENDLSGLD